jgi:glycosyltransferase involved in cell wall biosynthesis
LEEGTPSPREPVIRIALIGARSFPARHGGIERAVECLAEEYVARGHDVTVLVADDARTSGAPAPRVEVVRTVRGKYTQALVQALASAVRTSHAQFDVAHVHGIGPGIVVPLLKARGLPVVLTVHALDYERDKWPGPARTAFRLASRPGVRAADRVLCVGEHLGTDVTRLYGVATEVVPNGVSVPTQVDPAARLAELGLTSRGYLLHVGRLVPEKRVDVLLRAHAALAQAPPLVVVGSGAGSYADEHEAALRGLAGEGVRFLGAQPHEVVYELMAGAAALVNPSALEGLPLTVLEARALGTPVVLSDIAPHRELAGASTALGEVDSAPALSAALADLVADVAGRVAAAQGEAAEVRRRWSWSEVAERTLRTYEQLTPRSPVRSWDDGAR